MFKMQNSFKQTVKNIVANKCTELQSDVEMKHRDWSW